jgi:UDP-2,3-diacylglucosamine pyrophosphatase LpxH
MAYIRLLHISDLHFSFEPRRLDALTRIRLGFKEFQVLRVLFRLRYNGLFSSHDRDLARAIAEFADLNSSLLDGIIITGDLATTGLAEDLNIALSFLNAPPAAGVTSAQGMPTLAASGLNVFLLPGNHDRYATELGGSGGTDFDDVFIQFWENGSRVQAAIIERDGEKLGVIASDFALTQSSHSDVPYIRRLGQGRVYPEVLQMLEQTTVELRDEYPEIGIIWAVHFPPNAPGQSDWLGLINGRRLVALAKKQGIHHILAGHIHTDLTYEASAKPTLYVYCAHSACSVSTDGGNGFQVLEIEVVGPRIAITERAYHWDDSIDEFVRQ